VRGSALTLPFPVGYFATVVSTFPTEFIFEAATIQEVQRVLKPGGRLVVCATGRITAKGLWWQLLELAYRVTGQRPRMPVEPIFAQFRAAGLEPRFVARRVGAGEVWLLVAEKSEALRFTWGLT
jgi:ubiquinone/menaquinone biosynthesis C-methylase UbiE